MRWLWLALLMLWPAVAGAHPLRSAVLRVEAIDTVRHDVTWTFRSGLGPELNPQFPEDCRASEEPRRTVREGSVTRARWTVVCPKGLVGPVGVLGLDASTSAFLSIERPNLAPIEATLHRGAPEVVVGSDESRGLFTGYLKLGVEHILLGIDHVLFLVALLLLMKGGRRLVLAVTGFTLGHSATLAAAALGWVKLAVEPTEALIAASIVLLAAAIVRRHHEQSEPTPARAFGFCAGFGAVHGLGFAGAITELGLPEGNVLVALFGFNLGVEAGQLAIVAAALGAARGVRTFPAAAAAWPRARQALAYAIGTAGAFFVLGRIGWISGG